MRRYEFIHCVSMFSFEGYERGASGAEVAEGGGFMCAVEGH